jgi:hypothetical protein
MISKNKLLLFLLILNIIKFYYSLFRHIIYYHSGRRTIRVFRLEDGKKIADYKSTAKVRCMVATQDSKSVLIGCEDGTMSMFIIADPYYSDYVEYLREWRTDQLNLYSREG